MFSIGAIQNLRSMLADKRRMEDICRVFQGIYTRDQIVEAIDALKRHENNHDAQRHVNQVLAYQGSGVPLVNGRPADKVMRQRPAPMF